MAEYREIEDRCVLVLAHLSGSGVQLGEMRTKQAHLLQIHSDKVTMLALYNDRERAFADLGLTPDTGS